MIRRPTRSTVAILVMMAALFVGPLVVRRSSTFEGSDSQGADTVHQFDPHYKVWATPVLEPRSHEVESGLFAV